MTAENLERYKQEILKNFNFSVMEKSFVLWGFWEGARWIPSGAMMRRDWSLKPNGKVYQDLVFKTWWTNADGKTRTVKASLGKDGKTVECMLD